MAYDPLKYLPLLDDYTSRSADRLRRNASLVAFTVIVIDLFDVSLAGISIAGVPIIAGKECLAGSVAAVVLVFWSVAFAVRYCADVGRRRENIRLFKSIIDPIKRQIQKVEERISGDPHRAIPASHPQNKAVVKAYESQVRRTKVARGLLFASRLFEWLPAAIVIVWAAYILAGYLFGEASTYCSCRGSEALVGCV